jgi:hypothetical protein
MRVVVEAVMEVIVAVVGEVVAAAAVAVLSSPALHLPLLLPLPLLTSTSSAVGTVVVSVVVAMAPAAGVTGVFEQAVAGMSSLLVAPPSWGVDDLLTVIGAVLILAAVVIAGAGAGAFTGLAACFIVGFILRTLGLAGSSGCGAMSARQRRVDGGIHERVGVVSRVVLARSGGATVMLLASRIARLLFKKL